MITLYTFGPYFGLPDASPFVVKAMLLLKLAGLPFRDDSGGLGKAPKGKLPFIDDDGRVVADSSFIRIHLEQKYGIDFDEGLTPCQRGEAWAVEKKGEDHLYWAMIDIRWRDPQNFAKGPAQLFGLVPAPVRPLVGRVVRSQILKAARGHGFGRHSPGELAAWAMRDLDALSAILGDREFLMGPKICSADAAVYGIVSGLLCPLFESPIRTHAEGLRNLVAYRNRITALWFSATREGAPPLKPPAGP
jgi:glutathione S-transferase